MIPIDKSDMEVTAVKNELGYAIYKCNHFLFYSCLLSFEYLQTFFEDERGSNLYRWREKIPLLSKETDFP